MRRRMQAWARALNGVIKSGQARVFGLLLTYSNDNPFKVENKDVNNYMMYLRKTMGENLLAYAWVAELHPSGHGVHYHIAVVVKRNYVYKAEIYGKEKVLKNPSLMY